MTLNQIDANIIGGGHNGLVAAAYLERVVKKVFPLEQRETVGGVSVQANVKQRAIAILEQSQMTPQQATQTIEQILSGNPSLAFCPRMSHGSKMIHRNVTVPVGRLAAIMHQ